MFIFLPVLCLITFALLAITNLVHFSQTTKHAFVTHYSPTTELTHTDTHLQQLAALLQSTLFRYGTCSHMADKDSRLVSPDYRNIIS